LGNGVRAKALPTRECFKRNSYQNREKQKGEEEETTFVPLRPNFNSSRVGIWGPETSFPPLGSPGKINTKQNNNLERSAPHPFCNSGGPEKLCRNLKDFVISSSGQNDRR